MTHTIRSRPLALDGGRRAPLYSALGVMIVAALTGCMPDAPTAAPSMSPALVSASVVAASVATFMTDEATFEAALDGQELRREPFELDDTFNQPEPLIGATTLTLRGLVTSAPSLSWDDYGIGNTGRILLARPTVRFTFPAPTTAASVRIGNDVNFEDMQVRMALPNGEMFTVALESGEQRVLGVQSAEPFAYIELTSSTPSFPLDAIALYDDLSWVANAAPTVTGATVPASPVRLVPGGAEVTISEVTFSDPGGAEDGPFTTVIDCGNETQATEAGLCRYTTAGLFTVRVTVTDREGATSAPFFRWVRVHYDWSGYFSPVVNLPTLNVVRAGSKVPLKFSLNGNQGMGILSSHEPTSQGITCTGTLEHAPDREILETPGNSGLQYDAATDQYTYVWATRREWEGTCRELKLFFVDGTEQLLRFDFRR